MYIYICILHMVDKTIHTLAEGTTVCVCDMCVLRV